MMGWFAHYAIETFDVRNIQLKLRFEVASFRHFMN